MKRIIVGVDKSESAKAALRWALANASKGDVLVVVHAWNVYPVGGMDVPGYNPADFEVDANRLVKGIVGDVVDIDASDAMGPTIEPKTYHGHPGRTLIELSHGADLVVVGRRGHGGFTGLLLGSVGTYVVHHASCPVVVVPSDFSTASASEATAS